MYNREVFNDIVLHNTLTKEANEKFLEAFRDISKHTKYLQIIHEKYFLDSLVKAKTEKEIEDVYKKLQDFSEVPELFKFYKSFKLAKLKNKMPAFNYKNSKTIDYLSTVSRFILLNRRVPLVNLNIQQFYNSLVDFVFYFNLTIEDTLVFSSVYHKVIESYLTEPMDQTYEKAFKSFFNLRRGVKIHTYKYTENYGSALISLSLVLDEDLLNELNLLLESKKNVK